MTTFNLCSRCGGSGCCTHDVAPWIRPVAQVVGLAPAEVTVPCDSCRGSGVVATRAPLASWVK